MPNAGDVLSNGHRVEILSGKARLFPFVIEVPIELDKLFPNTASTRGSLQMDGVDKPVTESKHSLLRIIAVRLCIYTAKI